MPVDSDFFENANTAQLMWYQIQFALDEKENYETLRDVAEHNAMFVNPEGVKQVKESRKNTFVASDNDFENFVKLQFGRELPKNQEEECSFEDIMKNMEKSKEKVKDYMDVELDDITFTPFTRGSD